MVTVLPDRVLIDPMTVGYEGFHAFRITAIGGGWLDLTTITITAKWATATGTYVTGTVTVPTQTDDDLGAFEITTASTALTAALAGQWHLDIYLQRSGGNARRIRTRCVAMLESRQTEA